MPTVIPASLLNMQFHSITNLALGIICFVFQVVNLYRNVSGSFLIGISNYLHRLLPWPQARTMFTNKSELVFGVE
jgi:hypothetical protein